MSQVRTLTLLVELLMTVNLRGDVFVRYVQSMFVAPTAAANKRSDNRSTMFAKGPIDKLN